MLAARWRLIATLEQRAGTITKYNRVYDTDPRQTDTCNGKLQSPYDTRQQQQQQRQQQQQQQQQRQQQQWKRASDFFCFQNRSKIFEAVQVTNF